MGHIESLVDSAPGPLEEFVLSAIVEESDLDGAFSRSRQCPTPLRQRCSSDSLRSAKVCASEVIRRGDQEIVPQVPRRFGPCCHCCQRTLRLSFLPRVVE